MNCTPDLESPTLAQGDQSESSEIQITEINALLNQLEEQHHYHKKEAELALKQLQETQSQLEEQAQDNELLLLQLHQVQEELERYFLESQRLSKDKEKLNQKLDRQKTTLTNQKTMLFTGYREARKDWLASGKKLGNNMVKATYKKLLSATYEN